MKRGSTLVFLLISLGIQAGAEVSSRFRLHLASEPTSLTVLTQKSSASGYFLSQLACPLLEWKDGHLSNRSAHCEIKKKTKQIICQISKSATFSDGSPLLAEDYRQTFLKFLDPKRPAPRADLLFSLQNAAEYLQGKKSADQVGIAAQGQTLTFQLRPEASLRDFELLLTNPLLTAERGADELGLNNWKKIKTCGPYQISEWTPGQRILLKPNPGFAKKNSSRPELEFLFISEDLIALQLYEKSELDFLRRLPTSALPKYEKNPELHKIDQIRLDYFGGNLEFQAKGLLPALAQSVNFAEWQKLYFSKERPGCFGTPPQWTKGPVCWNHSIETAKSLFKKSAEKTKDLTLSYSKQGGDDHERTMIFLQNQWKTNLDFSVQIQGFENKIYLQKLQQNGLQFFRKGVAPERPTCLALLENFETGASENFVQFSMPQFDKILRDLRKSENEDPALCRRGLEILRDKAQLLPTGPLYFSLLVKKDWVGWHLNEINHLDLEGLRHKN